MGCSRVEVNFRWLISSQYYWLLSRRGYYIRGGGGRECGGES